jgi:PhnB protein
MATEPPKEPLEALRQPLVPIAPRPAFTTVLRNRIEEALDMSTPTASETPRTITTTSLVPYLCVDGADRAIAFYRDAFGAVETIRIAEPDGRVGHAELTIGSVTIMLSDEYLAIDVVSPTTLGGTPVALHLEVANVDAVHERAVAAGATTVREPADQFHGNRNAVVRDPFGHRWMLSTPVETLSTEELAARALDDGFETTTGGSAPGTDAPGSE